MTVDSQSASKGLDAKVSERNRLQGIAEKYRLEGFDVVIEPSKSLIPFDLGNYCPDLITRKGSDLGYIIELTANCDQTRHKRSYLKGSKQMTQ